MKKLLAYLPLVLVVMSIPAKTLAHTMQTNYLFTDELEFQSTYSTDEAAKNADVIIYAPNNLEKPWLESKTDEEGRFSFLPDQNIPGDWEVQIIDEGHGEVIIVPVTENGVDFENISHEAQQDLHYSSSPMSPLHSLLITVGVGGLWFTFLRKS
jgi:nickel transport protein